LVLERKINPGKVVDVTLRSPMSPRVIAGWTIVARSRRCYDCDREVAM
jgi:hypothetical protein